MSPDRTQFDVALVCALPGEAEAVRAIFDCEYGAFTKPAGDTNVYTTGEISGHHVVLVHMPGMGKVKAANVATNLRSSFPHIKVALVVGVCGAVPVTPNGQDINLGDVIISDGIVQIDFGRQYPDGFQRKRNPQDNLGPPSIELLGILALLKTEREAFRRQTCDAVESLQDKLGDARPVQDPFRSAAKRTKLSGPHIHTGIFASSDTVMKSSRDRDKIATREGVVAFEMEGAGIWPVLPTLIVKGVCDHADHRKDKLWQPYASVTAAAALKVLIQRYIPRIAAAPAAEQDTLTQEALRHLYVTDPAADMERIEGSKDDLLSDCYAWALDDSALHRWKADGRLLWISGDPGKGKTMLMMGLIREFSAQAYFFCQSTDNHLNNAVSVVRGLMWRLIDALPHLAQHLRSEYAKIGAGIFDGPNSLYILLKVFRAMLKDAPIYLFIDALDECDHQQEQLLKFIAEQAADPLSKAKWLVSSRNHANIKTILQCDQLSLEGNAPNISRAVQSFVRYKVDFLARTKGYDDDLCASVEATLVTKADSTFLWVALACKELESVESWDVQEVLEEFPTGLGPLYDRMMSQISSLRTSDLELCRRIIRLSIVAFRPLSLSELVSLLAPYKILTKDQMFRIVSKCTFLTTRYGVAYFIHQSAKDFLISSASFGSLPGLHQNAVDQCLGAMDKILKKNFGVLPNSGSPPHKALNRHSHGMAYACAFWVDHLLAAPSVDSAAAHQFLLKHLLHWIEALALMSRVATGIVSLRKLDELRQEEFYALAHDALRAVLQCSSAIEQAPLQVYSSMLIFAPEKSLVRQHFKDATPPELTPPRVPSQWSPLLQTLEGSSDAVSSMAFTDGLLVSGSPDGVFQVWDPASGTKIRRLQTDIVCHNFIPFGSDGNLATVSQGSVKLWDVATGALVRSYNVCTSDFVALGPPALMVTASHNKIGESGPMHVWDLTTATLIHKLKISYDFFGFFASGPQGELAYRARDSVYVWDLATGALLRTLTHPHYVDALAFASDGMMAAGSQTAIHLWDTAGTMVQTLQHTASVTSVAFGPAGIVASGSRNGDISIWTAAGTLVWTLNGHRGLRSLAFAPDGKLASGAYDCTIRLWDTTIDRPSALDGHASTATAVAFGPGMTASAASDGSVCIWTPAGLVRTLTGHPSHMNSLAIGSGLLAYSSTDAKVRLWDLASGTLVRTLPVDIPAPVCSLAIDQGRLAVATAYVVTVWHVDTGDLLQTLEIPEETFHVVFSDGQLFSYHYGAVVRVWDADINALVPADNGPPSLLRKAATDRPNTEGWTVLVGRSWLAWNGARTLWLPPSYRPKCWDIDDDSIVVGTESGLVFTIHHAKDRTMRTEAGPAPSRPLHRVLPFARAE